MLVAKRESHAHDHPTPDFLLEDLTYRMFRARLLLFSSLDVCMHHRWFPLITVPRLLFWTFEKQQVLL
jgi:hypothetical protein